MPLIMFGLDSRFVDFGVSDTLCGCIVICVYVGIILYNASVPSRSKGGSMLIRVPFESVLRIEFGFLISM